MSLHGNALRGRAVLVDARALHVECPHHKGLLVPVTDVKVSITHNRERSATRLAPQARLYVEGLCRYCDRYIYVEVEQGSVAALLMDEP